MNTPFARRFGAFLLVPALVLVAATASAQTGLPTIDAAEHADHGAYLVNSAGMSLYLFAQDGDDGSACDGDCAEAWPPLLVDGQVVFGEGVDLGAIGSIERNDGSQQLTYAGSPVYTFAQDAEPGDTSGHGVNDAWFLIDPNGEALEASASGGGAIESAARMPDGAYIFSENCAQCHGADGENASGAVALAGNAGLDNTGRTIRQVLFGGGHMPAFSDTLEPVEIAAVLTHVRESWGNAFGAVSEQEVVDELAKFQ